MTRSLPPQWDDTDGPTDPDPSGPRGNLAPTTWRTVVVAALCGAALGWFTLSFYEIRGAVVPILPWSLPVILGVVGAGVWLDARLLRAKVRDPHRIVSPTEGLVSLALGKAMVLTGAALVGACVVYVLTFVGHLAIPYPRARVIRGTVGALAFAVMSWAGWSLEKACRVPDDRDGKGTGKTP